MRTVSIKLDVWCDYVGDPPIYRVYVDDELLTERTFIWSSKDQYIREHIEVNLEPGKHTVSIHGGCEEWPNISKFRAGLIQVDGNPSPPTFTV